MYTLFELDEHYDMLLYEVKDKKTKETHICVGFDYFLLDDFLSEWMKKKMTWLRVRLPKKNTLNGKLTGLIMIRELRHCKVPIF